MMDRFAEFFEGDEGRLSMTRALMFMSWFPASYVVVANADKATASELLTIYLTAFVLGYLGGKGADIFMKPKIPAEPGTVNINQPEKVNVSS